MSQRIELDNLQFASRNSVVEGELQLSASSRLSGEVDSEASSPLCYVLRGASGERGEPLLLLTLRGDLVLQCQRCLQALTHRLEIDATFEVRVSIGDGDLLQEDLEDDSRDYLAASRSMDLLSLIEDEVLLALPAAPRHSSCAAPSVRQDPEAASPFGVLQNLKGQSGKTH